MAGYKCMPQLKTVYYFSPSSMKYIECYFQMDGWMDDNLVKE